MQNLFKLKRLSYKLVSRGFYLIFFAAGFILGLTLNKLNVVQYLIKLIKEIIYVE